MDKKMTITEIFDRAKKQLDGGDVKTGYEVAGHTFLSYYTNKDWTDFKDTMPDIHKKQFDDGKGGEMQEYPRKGIVYPPKMASYASSSRFMYRQGQKFDGFEYEKQLTTGLGGYPANLDGYLESKNVFVEAKCHEFYNYSRPERRKGHTDLLNGIIPMLDGKLAYDSSKKALYLSWNKKDSGRFDFKQMLCHLSGIANMVLGGGKKTVNFIYLAYRPSNELLAFVESQADKQRILDLFNDEKEMAETIDFKSIYRAILHYFNERRKYGYSEDEIKKMASSFRFIFCTQDNFKSVVESL